MVWVSVILILFGLGVLAGHIYDNCDDKTLIKKGQGR